VNNVANSMRDQAKIISQFRHFLHQEGASLRTQKNYLFDVNDFIAWLEINQPETDLTMTTKLMINGYIQHLQNQGKSISTINRKLSSLRILFTSLIQAQIMSSNPMNGVINLDPDQLLLPHRPLLQAYEANLKQTGIQTIDRIHHKTIVTDFLRWVSRKTPQ
jgi:site-specific recombinase XerD